MYIDFKKYKETGAYEVKYSFDETGLRDNPTIATFNTLQDAGLFIRYMLGKDMDKDQIDEIELLICRQDIIRREGLDEKPSVKPTNQQNRGRKNGR